MYMSDIKILEKNEEELEIVIPTVRIYSQDLGIEFGTENYTMLIRKNGKRETTEWIGIPNQESIRTLEGK